MGGFWHQWLSLGQDKWVVEALRWGYKIPFQGGTPQPPPLRESRKRHTSQVEQEALDKEVRTMQEKGAIELWRDGDPFLSRIFVVPKKSGNWRPIIDLRNLNELIWKTPFKMETKESIKLSVRQGDWMVSVDLQDAYYQIPIAKEDRRFLCFRWREQIFQFRVLPFGLCTAPQVFTRIFAPLASHLHLKGVRILRYLDDWLILGDSEESCAVSRDKTLELCRTLGVAVNWEKSSLEPSQRITYLGMNLDAVDHTAGPSQERKERFLTKAKKFLSRPAWKRKKWEKILGTMSSLEHLIPGSRLRMRTLQFNLQDRTHSRSKEIPISRESRRDVR